MDGHSQILASTNPSVVSYDPAFAYEIAHLIHEGIDRMYGPNRGEDVMYYLTIYNEPISQPAEPEDLDVEGLHKGIYLYEKAEGGEHEVSLLASGIGMQQALRAKEILAEKYNIGANIFSVTSWVELAREGRAKELQKLRTPGEQVDEAFATEQLKKGSGPYVAVSDFASDLQEQIRRFVPGDYTTLGADGFGFSDTRPAARRYFNIDAESVVVAALNALVREGKIDSSVAEQAAAELNITDPTKA
jgi:pyruvate dehydrogenase E1 component